MGTHTRTAVKARSSGLVNARVAAAEDRLRILGSDHIDMVCRPHLAGNNESCTLSNTSASDYYVMLRGYAAYSGVTLVGSF
jgi:hypothetical protein